MFIFGILYYLKMNLKFIKNEHLSMTRHAIYMNHGTQYNLSGKRHIKRFPAFLR